MEEFFDRMLGYSLDLRIHVPNPTASPTDEKLSSSALAAQSKSPKGQVVQTRFCDGGNCVTRASISTSGSKGSKSSKASKGSTTASINIHTRSSFDSVGTSSGPAFSGNFDSFGGSDGLAATSKGIGKGSKGKRRRILRSVQ